ncbi:MAG: flippase-like domain-containing protein [Elusimicrobiota bacterium]|jgi:uncharacterized protein (TIRG00374 family)|nr:flippase-like domain-containing protein [Elusimicrobiota bacterium]
MKKHIGKIILGCIFSAVLVYLTLKQINFKDSLAYIKQTNYFILVFAFLAYICAYLARAVRYYLLIYPIKKTPVLKNFPYTVLGFFMNNLIPLRIGELIRAKVTGERLSISRSGALATIVIERFLDIFVFIAAFFLIMHALNFPEFIKKTFYICAFVFGGSFIVLFIISIYNKNALSLISKFPLPLKIKSLVLSFIDKFIGGLVVLKNIKVLIGASFFSIVVWTIESSIFIISAYACGFNLSLSEALFVVIIIGIGAILPTAPGFVGAFEFMGITALSALGIGKDQAFVCVVTYHFTGLLSISILGLFSILYAKISFKDLFKFEEIQKDDIVKKQ